MRTHKKSKNYTHGTVSNAKTILTRRMPGKNLGSSPPNYNRKGGGPGTGHRAAPPLSPPSEPPRATRPSPHCLWASLRHDGTEPMKASPSPHCLTREHSSLSPPSRSPEHSPILPVFSPIFADCSDFLGRFRVIITRIHLHPRESGEDRHRIGEIHDDYLGKS